MLTNILALTLALSVVGAVEVVVPSPGAVNQDIQSAPPLIFPALDSNGDGRISDIELRQARYTFDLALTECRSVAIAALDKDDDGRVSLLEASEGKGRIGSLIHQARVLARAAHDHNADGIVSMTEAPQMVSALRSVLTQNGRHGVQTDGKKDVSKDEAVAALRAIVDGTGSLFALCDLNDDGQVGQTEASLAFDLIAIVADQ